MRIGAPWIGRRLARSFRSKQMRPIGLRHLYVQRACTNHPPSQLRSFRQDTECRLCIFYYWVMCSRCSSSAFLDCIREILAVRMISPGLLATNILIRHNFTRFCALFERAVTVLPSRRTDNGTERRTAEILPFCCAPAPGKSGDLPHHDCNGNALRQPSVAVGLRRPRRGLDLNRARGFAKSGARAFGPPCCDAGRRP